MKAKNFELFQRMIAVKTIVYKHHSTMLRLYDKHCVDADIAPYWSDDDEDEPNGGAMEDAEATNEVINDDEF
jgi:hypothetical protein